MTEKSNPPVEGSTLRMGFNSGSVMLLSNATAGLWPLGAIQLTMTITISAKR